MKIFANYFIFLSCLLLSFNCSYLTKNRNKTVRNSSEIDSLFNLVYVKLSSDTLSFNTCRTLFTKYSVDIDLNDTFFNNYNEFYISYYNRGNSFVRLINNVKLIQLFKSRNLDINNSNISWKEYNRIIIDLNNYNTDKDIGGENSQIFNFKEYIDKGLIIPESH